VNVPEPEQFPVIVQVPVIVFPFSLPDMFRVVPAGSDCTVNVKGPVTTFVLLVVTTRVPLALPPLGKHEPEVSVVKNVRSVTFKDPPLLMVKCVTKLIAPALPPPPTRSADQFPLAVVVVVVVVLFDPHPASIDASIRSPATSNFFMNFPLEVEWSN
jgi:hypothetical protein